jgi:hypothetical protein
VLSITTPYYGASISDTGVPRRTDTTNSPKVTLVSSGPVSTDANFQANLAREVKKVNDEIAFANVYPVLRVGLMYRY